MLYSSTRGKDNNGVDFNNSFVVTEDGSVGIGTTVPTEKFQVGDKCLTVSVDPCRVGIADRYKRKICYFHRSCFGNNFRRYWNHKSVADVPS